jgi:hypothetical protein
LNVRLTARHARSALVLAAVYLPWVVAPRADGPNTERPPVAADADDGTAIESRPTIELVTVDRPKVLPTPKRSDGLRPLSNLPVAGPAPDTASPLVWIGWRSGSVGWSGPLTMHLAERGPPLSSGD